MKKLWAPWRMTYLQPEEPGGADAVPDCIFCPENHESSWLIECNKWTMVLMNRYPYANGHVMVAPARHVAAFDELVEDELLSIHLQVQKVIRVLRTMFSPEGFNIGYNLGAAAGAGVAGHLHCHVVPRWNGDHNFMPVVADVRVIPQHLQETTDRFRSLWEEN